MPQRIATDYLEKQHTIRPGDRLHRLVAMLLDTWVDDVSDDRIAALEAQVESWRWMNSRAERLEQ